MESVKSQQPFTSGGTELRPSFRRIVFVGNPNSGKTTLFNRLTGLRAKTGNFPGTTVEMRQAWCRLGSHWVEFVDLPGLYSIDGPTQEQQVAADFLRRVTNDDQIPTFVVTVVDSTRLQRNLYLVSQVREMAPAMAVVLNMSDLARREGLSFDMTTLENDLGAPIIELSARSGSGIAELEALFCTWLCEKHPRFSLQAPCITACGACDGCPHAARFRWAEDLHSRVAHRARLSPGPDATEWMDRYATHPVTGILIFTAVMACLFQALFWLAETPMEWIDSAFTTLATWVAGTLPEGYLSSFLVDGMITGIAGAVVFLPQICILFFLLTLLEDTGYLARAAFVVDRWMAKVGLPGKAFIPILSAHACAIPAIMGTRTIDSPRDRLVTILILPLFTCSARIPVYVMVTAMLFADAPAKAGLIFTGAYFLGIIAAFTSAWILKGSLLKGEASPLIIEMPTYKWPCMRTAILTTFDRGLIFLRRAGTVIVAIIAGLWLLAQFPILPHEVMGSEYPSENMHLTTADAEALSLPDSDRARAQLEHSIVGRIGRFLEPVFAPLGFDWRITVSVITSFAAREVVVSTLSVLYGLDEDEASSEGVAARLRTQIPPSTGISLLVFFVLAMQCLPTQVITRRETGSWRWPLFQLFYMSILAYSAAWISFQVGSKFFG